MGSLVVYAPNVGGGGGLVLLRALLNAWPKSQSLTAILDARGQAEIGSAADGCDICWVRSNVGGRWRAERLLAKTASADDIVLCFHNLPPALPNRGTVYCYVQNANLVGLIPASHNSGWVRLRYVVERFIARRFRGRVDRYLVQTPNMAAALKNWYGDGAPPIDVLPFLADAKPGSQSRAAPLPATNETTRCSPAQWDFIYVSDGSFHKNHKRLFEAWRLLAERGHYPSLAITLHPIRDAGLRELLRDLVARWSVKIEDMGQVPHAEILDAYGRAGAMIFPSYAESFGIPLIEAQTVGLPILAPELDYVRDVCTPDVTFDPISARSIARAVERFLGYGTGPVDVMSPVEFVQALLDRTEPSKS